MIMKELQNKQELEELKRQEEERLRLEKEQEIVMRNDNEEIVAKLALDILKDTGRGKKARVDDDKYKNDEDKINFDSDEDHPVVFPELK